MPRYVNIALGGFIRGRDERLFDFLLLPIQIKSQLKEKSNVPGMARGNKTTDGQEWGVTDNGSDIKELAVM